MEQLLNFGAFTFTKDDSTCLVFEPNKTIMPEKEATVLINRATSDARLKALEHYLLVDERTWQDIPITFFNPDFVSDEE